MMKFPGYSIISTVRQSCKKNLFSRLRGRRKIMGIIFHGALCLMANLILVRLGLDDDDDVFWNVSAWKRANMYIVLSYLQTVFS